MRELQDKDQLEWIAKTTAEQDNFRAALRWAIEHNEGEMTIRLAGALSKFLGIRGYLSEGRGWLREALELDTEGVSPYRALAIYSAGALALRQRDYKVATDLLETSRSLYKQLGDKEG